MGCMASPVDKIHRLQFSKIPERRVVRGRFVQHGRAIVVQTEKGTLYTNIEPLNRHAHCGGLWGWSHDIHACLDALGLLTADERDQHRQWIDRLKEQSEITTQLYNARLAKGCPGVRVDRKKLIALWDRLDFYHQQRARDSVPRGATFKPEPKMPGLTKH